MDNFWIALGLTAFAGLSTGVGSAIAFFSERTNYRFLSVATGFSAGVMLYVSFTEILSKAGAWLRDDYSARLSNWLVAAFFFAGILFIFLIDHFVPSAENPHEIRRRDEVEELHEHEGPGAHQKNRLMRMGTFTALAIAIHNFPEGLATFLAALEDPAVGSAIAVAIALHNIPEGISVAVPIYYASGSRRSAFSWSLLSGLAEPAGAVLGYLILLPILSNGVTGAMFAAVAGIMVYISLDELLPASRAYGKGHDSIYGLLSGMIVIALSLLLMQ